jgi:RNA-binding protein YlmH
MERVSKGEFFDSMIEKMSNSRDFSNQYVEKKQVKISNSVVDVDPGINLADLGSNYETLDNCPA